MNTFPLKSGFLEDVNFISKSKTDAGGSQHFCDIDDSALMNQSMVISGNINNVNRGIDDISNNYASDDFNTNIDALMPDKKAIFLEDKNDVDSLNGKPLKSHCMDARTFSIACNQANLYKSESLDSVKAPEVEITSREESNGKFRVKFHIKGFGKT